MIDVALLGTGGTMPLPGRWLSSLLVRAAGSTVLFDCGEGTQITLKMLGWGFRGIGHIAITHFHADHCSGLPGMLLMIGNSGRGADEPLTIYGPPGIGKVIDGLRIVAPYLPYPVVIREFHGDPSDFAAVGPMTLRSCWGEHELPCLAYRLDLPRTPGFDAAKATALGVPVSVWNRLQHGETADVNGRTIRPDEVTGPPRRGLSVGLVTDSRPLPALARFFAGCDLLVSEASYAEADKADKAQENGHMTFAEAAGQARDAGVGKLWLTHFSPSLPDPHHFAPVARALFADTTIGSDRLTATLRYRDE